MTEQELDVIRTRCDAATPGPWELEVGGRYMDYEECCIYLRDDSIGSTNVINAEFIIHARTDIPALLAEVERLQRLLTMAKGDLAIECETCAYYRKQKECFYKCKKLVNDECHSSLWCWRGEAV